MNSGDTAFMLVAAALVMLMTPGLAFFYGGMVRSKNVLGTIMQNFVMLGVISIQWALFGYSLAFGPDVGHFIGNLDWIGLSGVGFEPFKAYAETIPHQTFMIYQCMFAVITPALITGAWAERMKFSTFMVFMILWSTLVYDPVAHWVWGDGGWLKNLGALDFAGGTVVHINAGIAALAAVLIMGPRKGYGGRGNGEAFIPHNLPMTVLGAGSCGSAGSGSTPAAPWQPVPWPPQRLRRRILAPAPRSSPGSGRNGFSGANPPPWVRPRARWRAWWPSLPPPAMSGPCRPLSSVWRPASSVTWRLWPR